MPERIADLKVDVASMPTPALRRHVFDPAHGLDMTDVTMLAVANNPMLKVARDERGVVHAQAFAAGLLPDPVLDFSRGYPTAGPAGSTAYGVGLSYALTSLLTHALDVRAARASARQVDLDLLWQEWQVMTQSRRLFVRCVYQAKMLELLDQETRQREQFHEQLAQAQAHGDVSLSDVSSDQSALQAVESRRDDMARQLLADRQALNGLLGLSADAVLHLLEPTAGSIPGEAAMARALTTLAQRRPDLLALQAGYESEDSRYRREIRRQFPSINIGFSQGRDTDAISSRNFQVSVSLPIFNRNRGNVAIEAATRQALHDDYRLRLVQAAAAVSRLLKNGAILQQQHAELVNSEAIRAQVDAALARTVSPGDLSGMQRLELRLRRDDQRLDLLSIEQTMFEQKIALEALVADIGEE